MSKLMDLFHSLTGTPVVADDPASVPQPPQPGEAHTDVAAAISDVRQFIGNPMIEAAANTVENLEAKLLDAIRAYLVAKLGPVVGPLAAGVASKAVHLVLDNVESYLHGVAASKAP